MYSPIAIANFFIESARRDGHSDLSPMKLQKLVYYAHGWCLASFDRPLINEQVEAWKFGPVIQSIFHAAKIYGMNHVADPLEESLFDPRNQEFRQRIPRIDSSDEDTKDLLDVVWDIYGQLSAYQLSNMTHAPGTPWDQVDEECHHDIPNHTDIAQKRIKQWFTDEADRLNEAGRRRESANG